MRPATIRGGDRIHPTEPTLVLLEVAEPIDGGEGSTSFVSTEPTVPLEVGIPILLGDARIASVTAQLTPVGITGDALGIPGTVDIPDQRLPRPEVGEAIPTQLDDGRPVWSSGWTTPSPSWMPDRPTATAAWSGGAARDRRSSTPSAPPSSPAPGSTGSGQPSTV